MWKFKIVVCSILYFYFCTYNSFHLIRRIFDGKFKICIDLVNYTMELFIIESQ